MNLESRITPGEPLAPAELEAIRRPALEPLRPMQQLLVVVYLIAAAAYLGWRSTTLNPTAPIFSGLIYGAELFGFAATLLHLFMVWKLTVRSPIAAVSGLSVDVLVPTYNEPVEMVRRTLLAVQNLHYPHTAWLLDDGARPEMAALAQELGVRYLQREDNLHAKAGNLNNALQHCRGEFVAIFDADHAPRRDFLDRTLGFFRDPEVAFVQTPQDFFNLDSFQHRRVGRRRGIWTEQSLFFRVIQRGKDRWNAAFFCGSCAVLRREALDRIGGFATETVTEDLATSVRLHAKGYRSVYLPEPMAFGIAPATASAFLNQRVRWGQGAMQVIRRDWMFLRPRLTLPQRLNYIASALTYFDGWQKLVFYLAPVWVLLSGTMPLLASAPQFLLLFIPFFILTFVVFEEVGRGYGRSSTIEQYNMARFAAFAWSTAGLVRRRLRFRVTNKAGMSNGASEARVVSPQILIGLLNVAAIVGGVLLWRSRQHLPVDGLVANLIWASVNIVMASLVVRFTMLRSRFRRREYRFPLPLPATLALDAQTMLVVVDDISPAGCRVYGRFPPEMDCERQVTGTLHLPNVEVPFRATVAALIPGENGTERYTKALGLAFEWTDTAARAELETFLFGSDLQWQLHGFEERNRTPSQVGRHLFSKRGISSGQYGEDGQLNWSVAMVQDTGPVLLSCPLDKDAVRVVASQQPPLPGRILMLRTHTRSGVESHQMRACRLAATLSTPTGPLYITEVEPC